MKIEKSVLDKIVAAMPERPPEVGGILGGKDGVVQCYKIDAGKAGRGCYYAPNVEVLNKVIHKWQEDDIGFLGLFHTHFWGVGTLSDGDREYMIRIVQVMPERINQLFFPIVVLPERTMVVYTAVRNGNSIDITDDELVVIQKGE